jgi:hypothetical protein
MRQKLTTSNRNYTAIIQSSEEEKEELEDMLRKKKEQINMKVSTKFQINPSTSG